MDIDTVDNYEQDSGNTGNNNGNRNGSHSHTSADGPKQGNSKHSKMEIDDEEDDDIDLIQNATNPTNHSNNSNGTHASNSDSDTNTNDTIDSNNEDTDDNNNENENGNELTRPNDRTQETQANTNNTNNTENRNENQKQNENSNAKTGATNEINEEDYEAVAIMIDELMKDDPAARIKAIRSLPLISKALGPRRTRSELIPYITQMIDDDDEILLVLIEELFRLKVLNLISEHEEASNEARIKSSQSMPKLDEIDINKKQKHSEHYFYYCFIPPFERLCSVEEKIIRDEAITKFGEILNEMPYDEPKYFESYVLKLFERLCQSDWHTARISGLFGMFLFVLSFCLIILALDQLTLGEIYCL